MKTINKILKEPFFYLILFVIVTIATCQSYDHKHPYEIGSHWNYSIICESGYKYKVLSDRRGVVPVYKRNGELLTCNEEYK